MKLKIFYSNYLIICKKIIINEKYCIKTTNIEFKIMLRINYYFRI